MMKKIDEKELEQVNGGGVLDWISQAIKTVIKTISVPVSRNGSQILPLGDTEQSEFRG